MLGTVHLVTTCARGARPARDVEFPVAVGAPYTKDTTRKRGERSDRSIVCKLINHLKTDPKEKKNTQLRMAKMRGEERRKPTGTGRQPVFLHCSGNDSLGTVPCTHRVPY